MAKRKAKSKKASSPKKSKKTSKASSRQQKVKSKIAEIRHVESQISRVVSSMERKVYQLELLTKFSSLLNSTLDTALVREKALEATCEILDCETATLYLVDPEKGELYFETVLGDVGKKLREIRLPIDDQSIAGYVAMTSESMVLNDVEKEKKHSKTAKKKTKGFVTRNMICVPLRAKDKTIGVLQAINRLTFNTRKPANFTEEDRGILETLSHQVAIAVENSQLHTRLRKSFLDTVMALAEAIEKKDRYTGGHTKRVVYYSECIAKYLDLTDEERDHVRLGAILHDVGKIGVEDKILKKPAPLDRYEWPVMKTHPELGYQIMKRVDGLKDVIGAMRYHHERWDGQGYPKGLKGEEIPFLARIVAVADTYDAMVSTRPYRKGLDPKIAYEEIVNHSGTQFDPLIVEAFKKAFANEKMGQRHAEKSRGVAAQAAS